MPLLLLLYLTRCGGVAICYDSGRSVFLERRRPREFSFQGVRPAAGPSLSSGDPNARRLSARRERRPRIPIWPDPLRPAACPLAGKGPGSDVHAANDIAPTTRPAS